MHSRISSVLARPMLRNFLTAFVLVFAMGAFANILGAKQDQGARPKHRQLPFQELPVQTRHLTRCRWRCCTGTTPILSGKSRCLMPLHSAWLLTDPTCGSPARASACLKCVPATLPSLVNSP